MHKDQLLLLFLLLRLAVEINGCTTFCGEVTNISYPFRVWKDPKGCGNPHYELTCINNRTVLHWNSGWHYVLSIDYTNHTIRVADVGLRKGNCSSLPLHSFSFNYGPFGYDHRYYMYVAIVGCTKAVDSPLYIDASSCLDGLQFSNFTGTRKRVYAMVNASVSSVETACTIELLVAIWSFDVNNLHTYAQIHEHMVYGFELEWSPTIYDKKPIAEKIGGYLLFIATTILSYLLYPIDFTFNQFNVPPIRENNPYVLAALWLFCIVLEFMIVKFILGAPCVMMLLIHKWRRKHLAMDQNVEDFLQSNNNFLPIRYSYSEIMKITGGLKDKLGEGGYGSVFKGRLRSSREVAVKILKKGKANGQDFISEVATIGRIHHVNVVGLIGYCFEGSKQALVYDFMHNGSLDKHIFSREEGISLDCNKVYEIALGVATGIEYLHRGCDVQILHFDIKPHNILLDKDFTPKVSDFGLAGLYPTNYNTVSLTAARGTLGYMAPELVFKNLGGISYKADVYSFGKLLMEMANGRKNADVITECSSETYFPLWVHDQLSKGLDFPVEEISEEDRRLVKKMVVVSLWCIQWNPSDRPSMRKALEMLEREVDDLQIPPKPLFYPPEMSMRDDGTCTDEGKDTISTSSISTITYEDSPHEYITTSIIHA